MIGFARARSALKKTAHASEQERADVRAARAVWRKRQAWLLAHPEQVGRIVFIDETGINTKMARLRGRCPRSRRMVAAIPHGHWKTMTFIAGLRCDGLTAPWVIEGAMDSDAFEKYARRAVEKRGAWLLFLPPYSPDFNPIELAFSKFKAHIKRLKPRTIDDLWKAAGKVCDLFRPDQCMKYFIADGYAPE